MRTTTFITSLIGILFAFSTTSCSQGPIIKGSKNYITKEVKVSNFNAIKLMGSADITYQQSSKTEVKIYGSDNIIPLLETFVDGNTLIIKFKKNTHIMNVGKLDIKVSSPDLNQLSINGSGDVKFANGIQTQGNIELGINGSGDIQGKSFKCRNMSISINGSGDISLHQINSAKCSAQISGSGDITLSGKTIDAEYHISGSGDISASGLEAINVTATTSGSGDISCFANGGKLSGRVSGSGDVSYKGNPKDIDFPRKGLHKMD